MGSVPVKNIEFASVNLGNDVQVDFPETELGQIISLLDTFLNTFQLARSLGLKLSQADLDPLHLVRDSLFETIWAAKQEGNIALPRESSWYGAQRHPIPANRITWNAVMAEHPVPPVRNGEEVLHQFVLVNVGDGIMLKHHGLIYHRRFSRVL